MLRALDGRPLAATLTGTIRPARVEHVRRAAILWRADHENDPHRETAWQWYCVGKTWRVHRGIEVRSILHGLHQAERIVRWDATTLREEPSA